MIDDKRLASTFASLVRLDSVSKEEAGVARFLREAFDDLGAETVVDGSAPHTGSDTGNLIARLKGDLDAAPLVLCAHMDTVEPGRGIVPVLADGWFSSAGDTILGADDKSGIAILLEVARDLAASGRPHCPVEFLLTTCEEVGLLGAKHLDTELLEGRVGFALDTRDTDRIITRAPAANRFTVEILGKEAHAGANPEAGINAIWLAAAAISRLKLGRIDQETTCNVGVIEGGTATNIVPRRVMVRGEVRSHNENRLAGVSQGISEAFREVIAAAAGPFEGLPSMTLDMKRSYDALTIPESHYAVRLARSAAANLGRSLTPKASGGGSDANVLFGKGFFLPVLGTGMKDVHTAAETVSLADMAATADLLLEAVRLHGEGAVGAD